MDKCPEQRSWQNGFTLVEMVVVICLVSILLVFVIPVFRDLGPDRHNTGKTASLVSLIRSLKHRSVLEKKDYFLTIDTRTDRVWVNRNEDDALIFDSDVRIQGVEIQAAGDHQGRDEITLAFYARGHSDRARIHLLEGEREVTLKIEPFLTQIDITDQYASFDDCRQ